MERIIFGLVFGLVIGSFIDCIANRSFTKQSFLGRSFCDHCKKTLPWYTLIPVISFLFLRGKCHSCKERISPESTLVEIIIGLLTAFILFTYLPLGFSSLQWEAQLIIVLDILFKLFAIYIFSIVFITDIKSGLIPDRITYPAIIIAAVYLITSTAFKTGVFYLSLKNSQLGQYLLPPHSDYFYRHVMSLIETVGWTFASGIGVGLFFLILILVTKGRGMGGGDMKLGIFIGLILGFPNSVAAIMLAFLLGSVFGIVLILSRVKKFGQTIPFGPFLSLASVVTILWGDQIINWYLNFRLF
jgi:prepilin signal peptidase PulO-like enzyme (type II secretory pathway)